MQQYQSRVAEGASLILIDDIVHDVTEFIDQHPGGRKLIQAYLGKDATQAFNVTVYNHSNAARNELICLRVARLTKASDEKRKAPD
jgi:stearoyl-CoA desaturase (delta-9 desaturase)